MHPGEGMCAWYRSETHLVFGDAPDWTRTLQPTNSVLALARAEKLVLCAQCLCLWCPSAREVFGDSAEVVACARRSRGKVQGSSISLHINS